MKFILSSNFWHQLLLKNNEVTKKHILFKSKQIRPLYKRRIFLHICVDISV